MAKRVDGNQSEIVSALRSAGASVAITSGVGKGFPDIVVGYRGLSYLMEIKDGNKPPSKRRLTEAEQQFMEGWRGHYRVVESANEALTAIGVING